MFYLKRVFDFSFSVFVVLLVFPIVLLACLSVYFYDLCNPIYASTRVGISGKPFKLYKIRSMIPRADRSGVTSTASDDNRLTKPGRFIRSLKIDELPQFLNVLLGDMSIVGPRPQVPVAVDMYSDNELMLLSVKPGITDFSSIVFSDESDILSGYDDPDLAYDIYIRKPKARLAQVYINHSSLALDLKIVFATFLSLFSRASALRVVAKILVSLDAPRDLVDLSLRRTPLLPSPRD